MKTMKVSKNLRDAYLRKLLKVVGEFHLAEIAALDHLKNGAEGNQTIDEACDHREVALTKAVYLTLASIDKILKKP